MKTARDYINQRARAIAIADGQNPEKAIKAMRAVSVVGNIAVGANGVQNTVSITDLNGTAVTGDRWRLRGKGGKHWALVAMVANNGVPGVDPEYGIKDFVLNDNPFNKMSFEDSLEDRSINASFFSLEAIRSGIDPFPWMDMPPFGPNDTLDVVAYQTDGVAAVLAQVEFWLLPVSDEYEPIGSGAYDCEPCKSGRE